MTKKKIDMSMLWEKSAKETLKQLATRPGRNTTTGSWLREGCYYFLLQRRLKFYTVVVRPLAPTSSVVLLALENSKTSFPVADRDEYDSVARQCLTDQRSSGLEPDTYVQRYSGVAVPAKPTSRCSCVQAWCGGVRSIVFQLVSADNEGDIDSSYLHGEPSFHDIISVRCLVRSIDR